MTSNTACTLVPYIIFIATIKKAAVVQQISPIFLAHPLGMFSHVTLTQSVNPNIIVELCVCLTENASQSETIGQAQSRQNDLFFRYMQSCPNDLVHHVLYWINQNDPRQLYAKWF